MAWAAGRTTSLELGTGVVVLPGRNPAVVAADGARATSAHRRPEVDPRELVADGWDEARRQVRRHVDEGITKFVVRPAVAPASWAGFLDEFAEHLLPLETPRD